MKKHLPSAIILCALLLALCLHAFALDNQTNHQKAEPAVAAVSTAAVLDSTAPTAKVTVNGAPISDAGATLVVEQVLYLSAVPVLAALWPDAQTSLADGLLTVTADGLYLEAAAGSAYFMVNDRYFYVPQFVAAENDALFLPAQQLAQALGCTLETDEQTGVVALTQTGQPATANDYVEEDLYWLSRAIYSESGNQPMKGRIAVGTVILNRVANEAFPDTIKEVIFAPRQFSPVANGTIFLTPDADSVIAAKLCLDGAREAGECLYFNVTSMVSWADKSRTLYCTIGDHNFYL
ncbi:MAG TPA: cell wall hydrolase [Candidatus Evtepia faecigallinarum]|nr:cell wall hydrolase [Candidatus Evtepia faecigallinarum]